MNWYEKAWTWSKKDGKPTMTVASLDYSVKKSVLVRVSKPTIKTGHTENINLFIVDHK